MTLHIFNSPDRFKVNWPVKRNSGLIDLTAIILNKIHLWSFALARYFLSLAFLAQLLEQKENYA